MSQLISSQWPRYPDPRPGQFCARGFDPPIAAAWKWRLQCPTASGFMEGLVNGITLSYLGYYFDEYLFQAITDGDPFGVTTISWSLAIHTRNEPDATTFGGSVQYLFICTVLPGVYVAACQPSYTWPSSRLTFNMGTPTQSPFGVDLFHGPLFLIPQEWDTPTSGVGVFP